MGLPYKSAADRAAAEAFFAGKPQAHALFDELAGRMAAWPGLALVSTKSRVAFLARTRFAWCGAAQKDGSLYLRWLLPHSLPSPRLRNDPLAEARWSIRVKLVSPADVDGELLGWLRAAYEWDVAGIKDVRVQLRGSRRP